MSEQSHRVYVQGIDWHDLMPGLRIFGTFRMAIAPTKLLLALMMVIITYLGGLALDSVWGPQVYPGELQSYIEKPHALFADWLTQRQEKYMYSNQRGGEVKLAGIFQATLQEELIAFKQLILAAAALDFGIAQMLTDRQMQSGGVMGALAMMVVGIPGWLYRTHPGFMAVFLLFAFIVTTIFGGAISRLAAVHAATNQRPSAFTGLRFTLKRFVWFVLCPIIPLTLMLLIGLLLAAVGWLFNFPGADMIGAMIFGVLLVGGFVIALLLIGLAGAANLLFPAMAVEATDAFDAISRSFSYVLGRPWRYLIYSATSLVYGAITYLFAAFVVYLVLWATKTFVGLWVFTEVGQGQTVIDRFDAILPDPRLGEVLPQAQLEHLGRSGSIAAHIVRVWVMLLVALLPAFVVSYYFCAQTWIYLLLRQAADGTDYSDIYLDADQEDGE